MNDEATGPQFERVLGMTAGALLRSGVEELRWTQDAGAAGTLPGLGAVGRVEHNVSGSWVTVAEQVPQGTFRIRREGQNLVVQLAVWYGDNAEERIVLSGDSVVGMRN